MCREAVEDAKVNAELNGENLRIQDIHLSVIPHVASKTDRSQCDLV